MKTDIVMLSIVGREREKGRERVGEGRRHIGEERMRERREGDIVGKRQESVRDRKKRRGRDKERSDF